MTKRKKSTAKYDTELTWVINNLTEDELASYDAMAVEKGFFERVLAALSELCEAGWRISTKWDDFSNSLQSTLIQLDSSKDNHGYALSARGADYLDTLGLCWYKFFVVAKGNLASVAVHYSNARG